MKHAKHAWFRHFITHFASLFVLISSAIAQNPAEQRWYQIEVTLFAYDNAMQIQEHWPMEVLSEPLPRNIRPLNFMTDALTLPEWQPDYTPVVNTELLAPEMPETAIPLQQSDFRLPDSERDAFLALPSSAHGFTDTNRALANAGSYRVLFHNAWRQPLTGANQATPVWVTGGGEFGQRHELEGSLTVRFNPGQDRVVVDARLWLTQFSALAPASGAEVRLPDLPAFIATTADEEVPPVAATDTQFTQAWYPVQVIPVVNSREMRSNEFHYIDHPAVGILIHVSPYMVPALPVDTGALL